jgi:hypothetical protein
MFATFVDAGREVPVRPADFADAVKFVADQRGSLDGFDLVSEGATTPSNAADTVAPFTEAGLTWWIEAMGWWRGGVEAARERIAAGP